MAPRSPSPRLGPASRSFRLRLLLAALVLLSVGFAFMLHRSSGDRVEVCIVDVGGVGGGCGADAVVVYRVWEDEGLEGLAAGDGRPYALLVPYQLAVERGLAPRCGCRLVEPAPGYVLVYKGFNVVLGDADEDTVAGVVGLLEGGSDRLSGYSLLYGFRAGSRVHLLGLECRRVEVGGSTSSKVFASVPVRSLDTLWSVDIVLAGFPDFEASVSARVLEGFLSG